jgi:hypothetical protein
MFTKKSHIKLLLASTILTSTALGMEQSAINNTLLLQSNTLKTIHPEKSLGKEISNSLPSYLFQEGKKDLSHVYKIGRKVYHEGWESIIGDSLETFMNSVNSRYLTKHLKSCNLGEDEFDINALRPLVTELRQVMGYLIQNFCMKGNLSILDQKSGKQNLIYLKIPQGRITTYHLDKTVYRFLAEKLIPDFVPLKGLFISLTDFAPVKNYLEYKMDEMIIKGLLGIYKKTTGKTIKTSINDIVRSFTKGSSKKQSKDKQLEVSLKEDIDLLKKETSSKEIILSKVPEEIKISSSLENIDEEDTLSSSKNVSKSLETEAYSHVWEYFEPQLNHFFRMAFTHVLAPISTTVLEETTDYALKSFLSNNTVIAGSYALGGISGYVSGSVLSCGLSFIPGLNLLAPIFQQSALNAVVGSQVVKWATAKSSEFITIKVKERLENNILNLMDYYSYNLVPLTRQEHVLYNLNPNPTKEELTIFSDDYKLREFLNQQTLFGQLIRDVVSAGGNVIDYLTEPFKQLGNYVKKFVSYCLGSKDASTQEILAQLDHEEGESKTVELTKEPFKKKSNLSAEIILGQLIEKLTKKKELTEKEQQLLTNLNNYPSFEIKQKTIELLTSWRHDSEKLTKELKNLEEKKTGHQKQLQNTYHLYGETIPTEFAAIYQWLGNDDWSGKFGVDFIIVEEIIAENLKDQINDFSDNEIELFQKAAKDEKFLEQYLKNFVTKHDKAKSKMVSYRDAQEILKDPLLIKNLPSAYAEAKNQEYIEKHQKSLGALEHSVLGHGLSKADLIDLHQHMTEKQLGLYATPSVIDLIEQQTPELVVINDKLKQMLQQIEPDIINHYSQFFINNFNFKDFFKEALPHVQKEIIVKNATLINLEEAKYAKAIKKYSQKELTQIQLAIATANWLAEHLAKTSEFNKFREELKEVLKNGFLRTKVYTHIQNSILDYILSTEELLGDWELISEKMIPEVIIDTKSTGLFSSFFSKSSVPSLTPIQLEKKTQIIEIKEIQPFGITPYSEVWPTHEYDVGGFRLSEIINKLVSEGRLQDITSLQLKDLIIIYNAIQEDKAKKTLEEETLFVIKHHFAEFLSFKNNLEGYKGKLFYSYDEVAHKLIEENKRLINQIKSQEKRKL